jgi:hypothetical protein
MRPTGSNADEWQLFLTEYYAEHSRYTPGLEFMSVQISEAIDCAIAAAIDGAGAERHALKAELSALEKHHVAREDWHKDNMRQTRVQMREDDAERDALKAEVYLLRKALTVAATAKDPVDFMREIDRLI